MAFQYVGNQAPQEKPGFVAGLARNIVNPVRQGLGQGVDLSYKLNHLLTGEDPEAAKARVASTFGTSNPFLNNQEQKNYNNGAGSYALQTLKNAAGFGSYAVPFGQGSGIFARAVVPGAVAGGLSSFSNNGNAGDIVKSSLMGGVTGGIFDKILSHISGGTIGNGLEEAGTNARKGIVNPQIPVAPDMLSKEAKLVGQAENIGLKGGGMNQLKQIDQLYNQANKQIDARLLLHNPTTSAQDILTGLRSSIAETGDHFVPGDTGYQSLLERELKLLEKKSQDGVLSVKDLFDFKNELGGNLKNAFKKESGQSSSAITPNEGVRLDLWKNIDNIITGIDPGLKDITKAQSALHRLTPGIAKSAEASSSFRIPFAGNKVPLPTQKLQGLQDMFGSFLQRSGRGLNATGEQMSPELASLLTNGGSRIPSNMGAPETVNPSNTYPAGSFSSASPELATTLQSSTPSNKMTTKDADAEKLNKILQVGVATGQIQPSTISALQALGAIPKDAKAKTEAQTAREDLTNLSQQAITLLDNRNVKTGAIAPRLEEFKSNFNQGDQPTLTFDNTIAQIKASIAKARAGTAFTPNEEKLLNKYTPNIGDSEQQLRTKLAGLQNIFNKE
jgi:hypothetical protein